MRFEEHQIKALLKGITSEDQAQIIKAFQKQFNVAIGLTPEDLASMKMELLIPLRDMIRGLVLTRKHVPQMLEAYQALRSAKLPRKTEFGLVKDEEE
ncbi:hypothetical protein [Paenibacillus arenilitoris]|uniref:Uncharacterized protein n=1 Tax=Paenibacillus arenilitoris TaxID=2772299 RepID=A0A927CSU9_9BACL|nr:hypothetical protein [Paenibacillus arenilitoris]MBD2870970.1 hypothetical protein [Paenibacillus arenilitoris]